MDEAALDALIDAGTAICGIDVKPEWRQAVRLHLTISLGHARVVLERPISDHVDPAPVFRARIRSRPGRRLPPPWFPAAPPPRW